MPSITRVSRMRCCAPAKCCARRRIISLPRAERPPDERLSNSSAMKPSPDTRRGGFFQSASDCVLPIGSK
ncbi:hypothetical protein RHECNPAF_280044 [Rhizobium etli CNPAF512]|nr:hypothetical protein RHECNPAF_280044 [Rhizobium etli CNPAF512]